MAKKQLFEHPTKRGVIVDESGAEVSVKELGESNRVSIKADGKVVLFEATVSKALKEFDELVQTIAGLNRVPVEAARAEVNRQARNHKLPEPFPGISESAREILERTHAASAPPASDLEFWSTFNFGR